MTRAEPSFDTLTFDEMLCAMNASDASYDGAFFTCVKSTGIFCFPSCPARKPRRENIKFTSTRAEAVALGFRPCKRCRPDLQEGRRSYEADLVTQVQSLVDQHLERIDTGELAARLAMSPHHLMRLFRRCTGVSLHEHILRCRVLKAKELLLASEATVLEISLGVGFESPSAFYDAFSRIAGMPPGEYRTVARAEVINHGT